MTTPPFKNVCLFQAAALLRNLLESPDAEKLPLERINELKALVIYMEETASGNPETFH